MFPCVGIKSFDLSQPAPADMGQHFGERIKTPLYRTICLFPFIYRRYRLPISATPPRRRLAVTEDSARIQDETTQELCLIL